MRKDRHAILQLVALGRVTPAEAERLLLLSNESRETAWIFSACLVLAVFGELHAHLQIPFAGSEAHSLAAAMLAALQHASSVIHHWFGGKP